MGMRFAIPSDHGLPHGSDCASRDPLCLVAGEQLGRCTPSPQLSKKSSAMG
jgi:hypothetical protein